MTTTLEAIPVHEWTGPTGVKFRDVCEPSGTYYHDTTPRAVIDALEHARATGAKIRLFTGDSKTGKEWFDEYDVYGTVGRSMGPIKVPLLIRTSRSCGGGAIGCDSIVRLFVNGREVWKHPNWKPFDYTIRNIGADEMPPSNRAYPKETLQSMGYTHAVDINGENHANFKSLDKAKRWVAFMRGERMCK